MLTMFLGSRVWAIINGEIEARTCCGFEHDGENLRVKTSEGGPSLIYLQECFVSCAEARNEIKTRLAMCCR